MGRDRNDTHADKNGTEAEEEQELVSSSKSKSKSKSRESSDSESEDDRKHVKSDKGKHKSGKRKRHCSRSYEDSDSDSDSYSEYSSSSSEYSESESDSEEERRKSKRKEKKRRREREEERERKRRKREKEKKRREKEKRKKKKEKFERGKKGAVTNLWGKYGIIRETDMWNKRPEFTAWLAEVKQVNLESLPNWEEKQMFKQFMEDHNTATFPSKKYYNLDAYHKHKMEKELKKGVTKVRQKERTVFNDEEQRRLELREAREKKKEEEVEALKRSMQSGMAQAMKEQAQLKEEMAYQYKIGNFEAAAAIQRRLDPDVAM